MNTEIELIQESINISQENILASKIRLGNKMAYMENLSQKLNTVNNEIDEEQQIYFMAVLEHISSSSNSDVAKGCLTAIIDKLNKNGQQVSHFTLNFFLLIKNINHL